MTTKTRTPGRPVVRQHWKLKGCTKCLGDLFWVNDYFENYWECLQCGHHEGTIDSFWSLPKKDARWRLAINCWENISKTGE